MNRKQATELVNKLAGSWSRNFKQETRDVYGKFLMELDYENALASISRLQMTFKFLPSIAELKKEYDIFNKPFEEEIATNVECWVCMDFGLITYDKRVFVRGAEYINEYTLYCDHCQKGNEEHYDGREMVKNQKSAYHMEPISQYIDVGELALINKEKYKDVKDVIASRKLVELRKEWK